MTALSRMNKSQRQKYEYNNLKKRLILYTKQIEQLNQKYFNDLENAHYLNMVFYCKTKIDRIENLLR